MAGPYVRFEREGAIAVVTIDRPPVNALNAQTLGELGAAVEALEADAAVRAVILTGGGQKAFVAGADIAEFPRLTPAAGRELAARGQAIFDRIEGSRKPYIAAINGVALGGGLELAMACDLRIAAEGARLGQPEINLGIIPGYGGTQRLPRLVGAGRAKAMIYTGDMIDAREALAMGLVNAVVPAAELLAAARQLAAKLAGKAPVALALAKRAIDQGLQRPLPAGLELEAELFGECVGTEDMREGVAAFFEKRAPRFQGR